MKQRTSVALLAGLLLGSGASVRAEEATYHNVISTNVFNLFISTLSAEYELVSSPKLGLFATGRYGSFKIGSDKTSWPGASVGIHMYPGGTGPAGFYWGPRLDWNQMTTTFSYTDFWTGVTTTKDATASFYGPRIEFGYRWNWGGFVLGLGGDGGYTIGELKDPFDSSQTLDYGGTAYGAHCMMGFAF